MNLLESNSLRGRFTLDTAIYLLNNRDQIIPEIITNFLV